MALDGGVVRGEEAVVLLSTRYVSASLEWAGCEDK